MLHHLIIAQEWHYDAVVPATITKRKAGKKKAGGASGHNLANRKPAPDHLAKTKHAIGEEKLSPERFFQSAMSTKAPGVLERRWDCKPDLKRKKQLPKLTLW